ncbi:MAG: hypothetical protein WCT07_03030 [Candidatus Paceibacterota bacterium]
MKNGLIFIPNTLTVVDLSALLGEEVHVIEEDMIDDGIYWWTLSNGVKISTDEQSHKMRIMPPDGSLSILFIPQQVAEDSPLYWVGDKVYWHEAFCECLYVLPAKASDDAKSIEIGLEGMDDYLLDIYNGLKNTLEFYFQNKDGVFVFRYFDERDEIIETKLLNKNGAKLRLQHYLQSCEGQCHLSDDFIESAMQFTDDPNQSKMILRCLPGSLSITRIES